MIALTIRHSFGAHNIAINCAVNSNRLTLSGPSGAGKSTILNIISGLITADEASIMIGDEQLSSLPPQQRAIGYQFQDNRLFPHLTVERNIRFAIKRGKANEAEAEQLIERLGLSYLLKRSPLMLSGGEARRVALARAMLSAQRLLLLDEPTASLNPERAEMVRTIIAEWQKKHGLTLIMASHDERDHGVLGGHHIRIGEPENKKLAADA